MDLIYGVYKVELTTTHDNAQPAHISTTEGKGELCPTCRVHYGAAL
jgi:hypothetical protein